MWLSPCVQESVAVKLLVCHALDYVIVGKLLVFFPLSFFLLMQATPLYFISIVLNELV